MSNKSTALLWIENAVTAQASNNRNCEELSLAYASIAQVYATLHLAEIVAELIPASRTEVPLIKGEEE